MKKIFTALLLISQLFSFSARADDMTVFLKSCALGTAAGALVGLASLAVSENPGDKVSNVAKGASLGLYAGIGFGLYTLYGQPPAKTYDDVSVWIAPQYHEQKIAGAQVHWLSYRF